MPALRKVSDSHWLCIEGGYLIRLMDLRSRLRSVAFCYNAIYSFFLFLWVFVLFFISELTETIL